MDISKTQDYLIKNKSKIKIIFFISVVLLTILATGRGLRNNVYLYVCIFVIAMYYGFELIIDLKHTNKQRIIKFIAGIIGGILLGKVLMFLF